MHFLNLPAQNALQHLEGCDIWVDTEFADFFFVKVGSSSLQVYFHDRHLITEKILLKGHFTNLFSHQRKVPMSRIRSQFKSFSRILRARANTGGRLFYTLLPWGSGFRILKHDFELRIRNLLTKGQFSVKCEKEAWRDHMMILTLNSVLTINFLYIRY